MIAHLTHVERVGPSKWSVTCDCGWKGDEERTKREAVASGEVHWQEQPLVTGLK